MAKSKSSRKRRPDRLAQRKDSYRVKTDNNGRRHIPVKWTSWLTRKVGGSTQLAAIAHTMIAWSNFGLGGKTVVSRKTLAKWFGPSADTQILKHCRKLVSLGVLNGVLEHNVKSVVVDVNREAAKRVRDERECYVADMDFGMLDYNEDCVRNSNLSTRIVLLACICTMRSNNARSYSCGGTGPADKACKLADCDAAPRVALIERHTGLSNSTVYRAFADAEKTGVFSTDAVFFGDGHVYTEYRAAANDLDLGTRRVGTILSFVNPAAFFRSGARMVAKKAAALYYGIIHGMVNGSEKLVKRLDTIIDELQGGHVGEYYRKSRTMVERMYRTVFGSDGSAVFSFLKEGV